MKKTRTRLLALLTVLTMLASMLPTTVWAEGEGTTGGDGSSGSVVDEVQDDTSGDDGSESFEADEPDDDSDPTEADTTPTPTPDSEDDEDEDSSVVKVSTWDELQRAVDAAEDNTPTTIKIIVDQIETEQTLVIPEGKNITLTGGKLIRSLNFYRY
jgi:hypothetical protein